MSLTKNFSKSFMIAAVLTLSAGMANASTYLLTDSPGAANTLLSVGDIASTVNPVDFTPSSDSFYFDLNFDTPVSLFLTTYASVTGLTLELFACADGDPCTVDGPLLASINSGSAQTVNLTAGLYHLFISGDVPAHTYYAAYAQAVPLPAAAWLLVSGLAGLGAMARRRKNEGVVEATAA